MGKYRLWTNCGVSLYPHVAMIKKQGVDRGSDFNQMEVLESLLCMLLFDFQHKDTDPEAKAFKNFQYNYTVSN